MHEINNEKMSSTVSLFSLSSWRQRRQEKEREGINLWTSQRGRMDYVYLIRKRETSWSEAVKLKKWCVRVCPCVYVYASVPTCWVDRNTERKLYFLTTSAILLWVIHYLFYGLEKSKLHLIRGKYFKRRNKQY